MQSASAVRDRAAPCWSPDLGRLLPGPRDTARWAERRDARHLDGALYDVAGLTKMWSVLDAWLQGTALFATAGVDATTYAPFARRIAAEVAGWLPGYAQQIDNGSSPAEVSSPETDARAMAHLIRARRLLVRVGIITAAGTR